MEEVEACLCHTPKTLLKTTKPDNKLEPALGKAAPLCAPGWPAQKGGRGPFLVAPPRTTDTAQPSRWLCYVSVALSLSASIHVQHHSTRGPDTAFTRSQCAHPDLCNHRQHSALSSMLLTAPFSKLFPASSG